MSTTPLPQSMTTSPEPFPEDLEEDFDEWDLGYPVQMEHWQALEYWTNYATEHAEELPMLASVLPRWEEIAQLPQCHWGPSPYPVVDFADLGPERAECPPEDRRMLPQVVDTVMDVLNRAAWDYLTQELTDDLKDAPDLTFDQVINAMNRAKEPLVKVALHEEMPVDVGTQLLWLAAWWIQDTKAEGLPPVPWIGYPEPEWDLTNPPRPRWLRTVINTWVQGRIDRGEITLP